MNVNRIQTAPDPAALRERIQQHLPEALRTGMTSALWAELLPDVVAIRTASAACTFRELNARCNRLVRALRARGMRAGDGVALLCSNRIEFAEVFTATRRAGLRLTPINWHLTGEEAGYIVRDCDAKAFIAEARFADEAARAAAGAPATSVRLAIGGAIEGFEDYERALQAESADD